MKNWLVILLMVLIAAARLQHAAISASYAQQAVRVETHMDVLALQEDSKGLLYQARYAPHWMRSQWLETKASLESLSADAKADTHVYGTALLRSLRHIYPALVKEPPTAP
jgi:hypothetical protein